MMVKRIGIFTIVILVLNFSGSFGQQMGCGGKMLSQSRDYYDIGLFEESVALITPCLGGSDLSEDQRIRALHLMVLNYVALDEVDKARTYMSSLIDIVPDFIPDIRDPKKVWELADEVKNGLEKDYTFSVATERDELLRLPSFTVVIDRKQIQERAYTNFTQIFRDIPGFDFYAQGGTRYGYLSTRGFREGEGGGVLLLINGIEQNDIRSNLGNWFPSIPIQNIERVEFVYGPSVALYGKKAYTGVVNVVTRKLEEGESISVLADVGYGNQGVGFGELILKAKSKAIEFDLSGKYYVDNLRGLDRDSSFRYSDLYYDRFDYGQHLNLGERDAREFAERYRHLLNNINLDVERNGQGEVIGISPSTIGVNNARARDINALDTTLNAHRPGYSNELRSFFVDARLQVSDIEFGYRGSFQDLGSVNDGTSRSLAGTDNGSTWKPQQVMFYSLFKKELFGKLLIKNTAFYKRDRLSEKSSYVSLDSYANGKLGLKDLAEGVRSGWRREYYYQSSQEFFQRLSATYTLSPNTRIFGGGEYRWSSVEGDYLKSDNGDPSVVGRGSSSFNNQYEAQSYGAFLSGEMMFSSLVHLTLSGRWDKDFLRSKAIFDDQWSYQVGLTLTPGVAIMKLLMGGAQKPPSISERYSTDFARSKDAGSLQSQHIRNYELDVSFLPSDEFNISFAGFLSHYDDLIMEKWNESSLDKYYEFQNVGDSEVYGFLMNANYKFKNLSLYANYSYSKGNLKASGQKKRDLGGIPTNTLNIGLNYNYQDKVNLNLGGNYISGFKVGEGTTLQYNPTKDLKNIFRLNAAVTWSNIVKGLSLQLISENLLDQNYRFLGRLSGDGVLRAPYIPQSRMLYQGRLIYEFR